MTRSGIDSFLFQPVCRTAKARMRCTEFECSAENGAQPDITAFFATTVYIDGLNLYAQVSACANVLKT